MSVAHDAHCDDGLHDVDVAAPLTEAITISGTNRYLVVGVHVVRFGAPTATVTHNGVSMSVIDSQAQTSRRLYLFGLVAPDTGTHNVVVTPDADNTVIVFGADSYTGVDQTTPVGDTDKASANTAHCTVSVTSTSASDLVVDVFGSERAPTVDGGQTQLYNREPAPGGGDWVAGSTKPGTAGSVTVGWTLSIFDCFQIGANLIAAPPSGVRRRVMEIF